MSHMFYKCNSLISLPDISKWNTKNVTDMSDMFYNCTSLESLPDISKWDTQNVTNMSNMFYECCSLKSLPDISKWKTWNLSIIFYMFYNCRSLEYIPNISKWYISKVYDMSYMFSGCSSLKSLPDISKWNIQRNIYMENMFYGCKLLKNSSDISKELMSKLNPITIIYNTNNIKNKSYPVLKLFDEEFVKNNRNNCYILINNIRHELCKEIKLNELRILKNKLEIKLIEINSITDMRYMFYGCSSLESLPDISKWDMSNVTCISKMFVGCKCKSINIMTIEYKFSDYTDKIKLFDDNFVKNNKDKCYLLIYGKKYELCNVFLLNNQLKKKVII